MNLPLDTAQDPAVQRRDEHFQGNQIANLPTTPGIKDGEALTLKLKDGEDLDDMRSVLGIKDYGSIRLSHVLKPFGISTMRNRHRNGIIGTAIPFTKGLV